MRIAMTSDDGADAPGLAALHRAIEARGHEHLVLANEEEMSNVGTSLRLPGPGAVLLRRDGCTWTFSRSTPALLAVAACSGLAGPPPAVFVSGVNEGPNVGRVSLHSGTLGAALAAAAAGVPAVAVSCDDVYSTGGQEGGVLYLDAAAAVAVAIAAELCAAQYREAVNVNVPNLPISALAGIALATPSAVMPVAELDPGGRLRVTVSSPALVAGSEVDLLSRGYVTLSGGWGFGAGPAEVAAAATAAARILPENLA
jgi:5'-nucleotidase